LDKEARLEAKLRAMELDSMNIAEAQIDAGELALIRIYNQVYETVDGRRVKMTKRRKEAKYKAEAKRIFSKELDVSKDAIAQLTALDRNA